ncbi:putative MPP superfamily phosphohydrolase [Marmoricola bigeumensis]|uniref:MPP superfamily phosphohydrolase n=1 Tax=Nocardioides marmoribigeumensis TaxID=433649 RepID=A0ABU2BU64_9ACTN|nr:putative MPP superfamily phosphohydrolase [Nocardioides marmoribigeumensis]
MPIDEVSPADQAVTAARRGLGAVGTVAALGAAGLGYAWWEARWFTLRHVDLPVLPAGAPDLRVLHLTDVHLAPYQGRKRAWLSSLAALEPNLVVDTGDNLAHRDAVGPLVEELGALLDVPGVFVLGSNDYFEPTLRNPVRYLLPDDGKRHTDIAQLPWRDLKHRLTDRGWLDLTNTRDSLEVRGVRIAFAGVDDPHLGYDDLGAVAGPADPGADLRLGVAHAPYLRVLDQYAADGYDAILAGHTHGGQLCLPFNRALVTNCDLDRARASGLSRHGRTWLHVSAGAGTSPYAVARFCCRPSATLLRLVPRDR